MNTAALLQEALALHDRGAIGEAADRYGRVLAADPNNVEALFRLGRAHCQQGRLESGIELFQRALRIDPHHARAHNLQGLALARLGRAAEAIACFDRAIAADPKFADAFANKADALSVLGRNLEAVREYDRALALAPETVLTLTNRGVALHQAGRAQEALASFDRARALDPNSFPVHENRARALSTLGRYADAIAGFDRAIAIQPGSASAHWDRGVALLHIDQVREAFASFDRALALQSELVANLPKLGQMLLRDGKSTVALAVAVRALELAETGAARTLFAECAIATEAYPVNDEFRLRVAQALEGPWVRPADLARLAADLVKMDEKTGRLVQHAAKAWPERLSSEQLLGPAGLAGISGDRLLRALLEATPLHDVAMERFLTTVRYAVLQLAGSSAASDSAADVLAFCCALARQCFINEYVYDLRAEETAEIERLRQSLATAAASNAPIPPLRLAALAAYIPLHALPDAASLLQRSWPAPISALLDQQVREPMAEQKLRKSMPKLTPVENAVSVALQDIYEESPYPRWVKTPAEVEPAPLDAILRSLFPSSPLQALGTTQGTDVLVAGCGTGREPIEYAQAITGARMLAVDLSAASLAYAQNKARALGIGNLEFAQADILKLGSIGRTFDFILASGVLHHFEEPEAAWSILLSLLRPHGVMRVSFYSAMARRVVEAARKFAAEHGYRPVPEDIRRCRQEIMALPDNVPAKRATGLADFFALSECRYALFQPPEQHLSLPEIARFLTRNRLTLLGVEADAAARARYTERFPAEKAMNDLNNWQFLEREHPDIYGAMYGIWIQKP